MCSLDRLWRLLRTAVGVFLDLLTFFRLILRTSQAVAAENLFLRKQLALYVERQTKPHRATDAVRFTPVLRKNWVGPVGVGLRTGHSGGEARTTLTKVFLSVFRR